MAFASSQILVHSGKNARDRVTMLPAAAGPALLRHLQGTRRRHDDDLRRGGGWVELPDALARKYPNAGREWGWQRVFPATRIYVDHATGQRRRHHLHESVLQRAVTNAVRTAGLTTPAALPCYAAGDAATTVLHGTVQWALAGLASRKE